MTDKQQLHLVAQPIFVAEVYIMYQNSVLLFKRSPHKKKFPGFWSIPGGHIEAGEDPLAAAIREVKEETGISLSSDSIQLKVVAMHHHRDREELYIAFAFIAKLAKKPTKLTSTDEGIAHWVNKKKMFALENVFEPVKYYFHHVLDENSGVMYNNSQWDHSQLVKVFSQTVDRNY